LSYRREKVLRENADQQTQVAVKARQDAEDLVRFMVLGLHDRLEKSADRELLRDLNIKAGDYYRQFDASNLTKEAIHQYGTSIRYLGNALVVQGELQKASEVCSRALKIMTERRTREPESVYRSDLYEAHVTMAEISMAQGNLVAARTNLFQALQFSQELAREHPDIMDVQRMPSVVLATSVKLEMLDQNVPEALRLQRQAMEIDRAIMAKFPGEGAVDLVSDEMHLAHLLDLQGEHTAAISLAENSLSARRKLLLQHPEDAKALFGLLAALDGFTDSLVAAKKYVDAAGPAAEAIQIADQLASKDPKNLEWQRNLAMSHLNAAEIASETGKLKIAREEIEKVLNITEAIAAHESSRSQWQRDLAVALARLSAIHELQGDRNAALTNQMRSLAIHQALSTQEPDNLTFQTDIANAADTLADLHESRGQPGRKEALRYAKIGLESLTRLQKANRLLPAQKELFSRVTEKVRQLEAAADH
jgi:tetratricopeptide (TPR) repeat protein